MRILPLHAVLCLVIAVAGAVAAGEGPVAVVLAQRGAVLAGPVQVQPKGLTVGGTVLAWSDVAAAALPGRIASEIECGVVTIDGEVLRGVPRQVDKAELSFASDLHGDVRLPLANLAAVVLTPQRAADLPGLLRADPGAIMANGERVGGAMTFCNAEAIGIDTGRRVAQVPRGRIAVVVLRAARPAQSGRERVWFGLATGDRLLVDSVATADGSLQIQGPSGTATIDARALAQVWCDGGRVQHLAMLAPLRATALDRIGAALPVAAGAGFPVVAGGLPATDGIILPATGEVAWKSPSTGTLVLWAACPAGGGEAVARIALDGAVAWEQTLRPGAAPVPVSLPLKGAAEIALRSAPGASGETARCAVAWCHPILVK